MAKVLIVEDDEAMSDMLAAILEQQRHVIEQVYDGAAALERVRTYKYDLIILDWQLPSMSGPELCKEIKHNRATSPVLMLTARVTIEDKERGLEAGADDYLAKPINVQEFSARVRALLRRSATEEDEKLVFADLILDSESGRCTRGTRNISLPPKEAMLLALLMKQPKEHVTTETLITRLWGKDGSRASLANCLKRLRNKLTEDGETDLIETVPGLGYRLI